MYRCGECEREFYDLKKYSEPRGEYWGIPCWEDIWGCPFCGSYDYAEVRYDEYEEEEEEYDDDEE